MAVRKIALPWSAGACCWPARVAQTESPSTAFLQPFPSSVSSAFKRHLWPYFPAIVVSGSRLWMAACSGSDVGEACSASPAPWRLFVLSVSLPLFPLPLAVVLLPLSSPLALPIALQNPSLRIGQCQWPSLLQETSPLPAAITQVCLLLHLPLLSCSSLITIGRIRAFFSITI